MARRLKIFTLCALAAISMAVTARHDFNDPDQNPLSVNGAWSTGYTSTDAPEIVSNGVRDSAANSVDAVATLASPSIGNEQFAQVRFGTIAGASVIYAGVVLRSSAPATRTQYQFQATPNESGLTSVINEFGVGNIATENATSWATNDSIIGIADGSTLNLFRLSGSTLTLVLTAINANIASGRAGLMVNMATGGTLSNIVMDDFQAGDLPIVHIGTGAQAVSTTSGGSLACAYPAGYTAIQNDVILAITVGRPTGTVQVTPPSNYTQIASSLREVGANDLRLQIFRRVLNASEAAPTVTVPASYSGTSAGLSCQTLVYRGVDPRTPEDATGVTSNSAAADQFQPTGITTVTNWARVVGVCSTADDNALGHAASLTRGFADRMSGASYDTTTGGDHAVMASDIAWPVAGAVSMPTYDITLVGTDPWACAAVALRPAQRSLAYQPYQAGFQHMIVR